MEQIESSSHFEREKCQISPAGVWWRKSKGENWVFRLPGIFWMWSRARECNSYIKELRAQNKVQKSDLSIEIIVDGKVKKKLVQLREMRKVNSVNFSAGIGSFAGSILEEQLYPSFWTNWAVFGTQQLAEPNTDISAMAVVLFMVAISKNCQ